MICWIDISNAGAPGTRIDTQLTGSARDICEILVMKTVYFEPPRSETRLFFPLEVLGESHYQQNIKDAILYSVMVEKTDMSYKDEKLLASLVLEDENKADPGNAVRVEIDDKTVGYLNKDNAREYRSQLKKLGLEDTTGTCQAAVYGKRMNDKGAMIFGVYLALEPERYLTIGEAPQKKKGCLASMFTKNNP